MTLSDLCTQVSILDVWKALGGPEIRHNRSIPWYRGGTKPTVLLNPKTNRWTDFAMDESGGILQLIQNALKCSKIEAVKWLENYAGVRTDSKQSNGPDWAAVFAWRDAHIQELKDFSESVDRLKIYALRCHNVCSTEDGRDLWWKRWTILSGVQGTTLRDIETLEKLRGPDLSTAYTEHLQTFGDSREQDKFYAAKTLELPWHVFQQTMALDRVDDATSGQNSHANWQPNESHLSTR